MFDWLFKLGEVKTAQEVRNLITWPLLIACYVTQTGPAIHFFNFHLTLSNTAFNFQWSGFMVQMVANDWIRTGLLVLMFAMKAVWICSIYHFIWRAIFALKKFQFEVLIGLVMFCSSLGFILSFSMVELFALRKWPTAGILNPCWTFACFATGLSFHAYAHQLRAQETSDAPPTANPEFGFEANPLAHEDQQAAMEESKPVGA